MRGVILCGGLGSRLLPLTTSINKHILPVFNKPMVYYPIETLVNGGVTEIAIVIGEHGGDGVRETIGDGSRWGLERLEYFVQKGEGGIADALRLTEDFVGNERVVVCLGDNIFEDNLSFEFPCLPENFAQIYLKEVVDPQRFGVVEFNGKKDLNYPIDIARDIIRIIEKPVVAPSNYAVTGLYVYPGDTLFDIIRTLKPSKRNELEVTDINNAYLEADLLDYKILNGAWKDCGTFESLYYANTFVAGQHMHKKHANKFKKVLTLLS